jgi:hypothetical protein
MRGCEKAAVGMNGNDPSRLKKTDTPARDENSHERIARADGASRGSGLDMMDAGAANRGSPFKETES